MNSKHLSIYVHLWIHSCIQTQMNMHTHVGLSSVSIFHFFLHQFIFSIMVTQNIHWWYLSSWTFYFERKCMNYKRSHMHEQQLYISYFFPQNYYYEKGWPCTMNDWITNLVNWIHWTKLNQTKPNQWSQWNSLTRIANSSSASLRISHTVWNLKFH